MMQTDRSTPTGAATLDKSMALLIALIEDGGATSLSRLAADLGLPPSTARRMAAAMERRGLVMRSAPGRFAAGIALAQLNWPTPDELLARAARPVLRRLARRCALTAHVGVFEDQMVTYVAKEHGRTNPIFTRESQQLEAYCSGVGKVLLAFLGEAEREAYLIAGGFVALTPRTITDPARLREALMLVRAQGYAIDDGEIAEGLECLGVPIRNAAGEVIAALSISGAATRFRRYAREELLALLADASATINRRLDPA